MPYANLSAFIWIFMYDEILISEEMKLQKLLLSC